MAEIAMRIGAQQKEEIEDMDGGRGGDPLPGGNGRERHEGRDRQAHERAHQHDESDLTSAFQLACIKAAHSTSAVTSGVRAIATAQARWQAAWRPAATSRKAGASARQIGCASRQRAA